MTLKPTILTPRHEPAASPNGIRPRPGAAPVDVGQVDVERAAAVLAGVARRTPVLAAAGLSERAGVPVWLKCENHQHTGSFKLRGAYARTALADPAARARGLVAASAGNHAQGVAFAAARFGVDARIFVPAGANPVKVARTRGWGAQVTHVAGPVDAALAAAEAYAADGGRLLVHPFDDLAVIAGQGTIGTELLAQLPDLATVLVGVGGGGLVTGLAAAVKRRRPDVRVIGVQAAGAPSFARSWHAGHLVAAPASTIADGMAVRRAGTLTLALAAGLLDDVVTVEEEAIWAAMVVLARENDQLVEPAGAAGTAALLTRPDLADGPTVVILSGGNIDDDMAAAVRSLAGRTVA
jgi:threonine dehydratase